MRGTRKSVLAMVIGASLVWAGIVPAWGGEDDGGGTTGGEREEVTLGGLSLGDGLEGLVGEGDGSLSIEVPIGAVTLRWDSRAVGDASPGSEGGLGGGWGFGLGGLDRQGGLRVRPAAACDVPFEVAASWPSGLLGYDRRDVWFGVLPAGSKLAARDDGAAGAAAEVGAVGVRDAFAELRELGGAVTTFGSAGEPLARATATGQRIDWVWGDAGAERRLERVVDAEGMVTTLDWTRGRGAVVIRPAANVLDAAGDAEGTPERRWRVELDDGLVTSVTDASGARTEFGYADGLLAWTTAPSGATTQVEWQRAADGVARVATARTVGAAGELGVRRWSIVGGSPTGWPGGTAAGFTAQLTDGATDVRSRYDGDGRLREKTVHIRTASGMREVQAQRFDYPATPGGRAARDADRPRTVPQPARTEVVYRDAAGATRTSAASIAYDELGRVMRSTAADGTVTEHRYDDQTVAPDRPAIGLPVFERVTATDGLVTEQTVELNAERTAAVRTETWTGRQGEPLARVARTEFDVEPDGFVTEERRYPGGEAEAEPLVVQRERATDLTAGTVTTTETVAAGTPLATSTLQTASLVHGGVIGTTDETGRGTSAEYDQLGRAVTAVDETGRTTRTRYEHAQQHGRNATTVTGPDRVATTAERDPFGRVVRITDNIDRGTAVEGHVRVAETRDYPEPGVVRVTDAWGATTTTEQDVFGRVIRSTGPTGLAHVTDYDDVAGTVTTGITPTGRLADAELVTTQRRDETARTVETSGTRRDGVPVATTLSSFDGLGRETSSFDGSTRLETGYDARGNAVSRADRVRRGDADADAELRVTLTEYTYDGLGRLIASTVHDGADASAPASRRTEYDLTVSGDVRTERVTANGATTAREFTYSPTGELDAITTDGVAREQQHDDAGNLTRDIDGTDYVYDAANRLTSKTPAGAAPARITYWPDGSRREVTDHTGTREYFWAGGAVVNERRDDRTTSYLLGAGRHARTGTGTGTGTGTDDTAEHYVTDRHGSITELIGERAEIATAYSYSDYGVATVDRRAPAEPADPNPFQYSGELTDPDGGQLLGPRVYRSKFMRFDTPDDAPQHSVYGYADANPITRVDPTGRTATSDARAWMLTALSITIGVVATVAQLATMTAIGAAVAMVGALVFDAAVTVAQTVNDQHVAFMPASASVALGFAAIAASTVFGGMIRGAGGGAKKVAEEAVELQDLAPVFRRQRPIEKLLEPRAVDPAGIRNHGWHPRDVTVNSFIQQRNLDRHETIMNVMEGEWEHIAIFDLSTRPDRADWIRRPMGYHWTSWPLHVRQHTAHLRQATLRSHYHHSFAHFRLVSKNGGLWGWMNDLLPADVVEAIRHYTLTYTSKRSGLVTTLRDARPHADAMLARFDRDFIGYHHLLPSRDHEFLETMTERVGDALVALGNTGHKIRALSTHVYR